MFSKDAEGSWDIYEIHPKEGYNPSPSAISGGAFILSKHGYDGIGHQQFTFIAEGPLEEIVARVLAMLVMLE